MAQQLFFALRHGFSEAMTTGTIASSPSICLDHFGLTETGREQCQAAAVSFQRYLDQKTQLFKNFSIRIISSDFKRAAETAQIFASTLSERIHSSDLSKKASFSGELPIEYSELLRERNFGDFDGKVSLHFIVFCFAFRISVHIVLSGSLEKRLYIRMSYSR